MAKVPSKLLVTVPKAVADRYGTRPGDEIEWLASGGTIRSFPWKEDENNKPRRASSPLRLGDSQTAEEE